MRGNLHRAGESFEKFLGASTSSNANDPLAANPALVGLAELAREWNRLDRAQELLERADQNIRHVIAAPRFYLTYAAVLRATLTGPGAGTKPLRLAA